jgi:hypothetical protein
VPCYYQIEINGEIIKYSPKAPLDQVPVLEAGVVGTETVIVAPLGSKKRIAGGAPVDIY